MKKRIFAKLFVIVLFLVNCTNSSVSGQTEEKQELDLLKDEINALASSGNCTADGDCSFIAFGSKPCGGSWSYLSYNNSIDTELLISKVTHYNKLEQEFNIKYGMSSDCMAVTPPSRVECIDGVCTAIYD